MADSQAADPDATTQQKAVRSLAVRKAAARVAVAASKKTGRPVDPRVKELAESQVTGPTGRDGSTPKN